MDVDEEDDEQVEERTCCGVGHAWQNDPFSFLSQ